MCDITSQNRDTYYENIKRVIYDKLNQDQERLETIEEYKFYKNYLNLNDKIYIKAKLLLD
jgi:hypothetical protein